MLEKLEEISYEGLGTNTAEALNYLHQKVSSKMLLYMYSVINECRFTPNLAEAELLLVLA